MEEVGSSEFSVKSEKPRAPLVTLPSHRFILFSLLPSFLCCCCCCFGPWKLGGLTKKGRKGHRDFLNAGGTALSPSCCFTLQSTLERQVWSRLSVSVIESQLEPGSVLHVLRTCSPHSSSPRQGHCPCFVGAEVETQRH